jgi:hypothetical protein
MPGYVRLSRRARDIAWLSDPATSSAQLGMLRAPHVRLGKEPCPIRQMVLRSYDDLRDDPSDDLHIRGSTRVTFLKPTFLIHDGLNIKQRGAQMAQLGWSRVRPRSAPPKRAIPMLAGGTHARPDYDRSLWPTWYDDIPLRAIPPCPENHEGFQKVWYTSRKILDVVSATSGLALQWSAKPLQPQTPITLAVDFEHTVRDVERALNKYLHFLLPSGKAWILVGPLPSHFNDHVLTLCSKQSECQLRVVLTDRARVASPHTAY